MRRRRRRRRQVKLELLVVHCLTYHVSEGGVRCYDNDPSSLPSITYDEAGLLRLKLELQLTDRQAAGVVDYSHRCTNKSTLFDSQKHTI